MVPVFARAGEGKVHHTDGRESDLYWKGRRVDPGFASSVKGPLHASKICDALTGLKLYFASVPGALPWAGIFWPFKQIPWLRLFTNESVHLLILIVIALLPQPFGRNPNQYYNGWQSSTTDELKLLEEIRCTALPSVGVMRVHVRRVEVSE